METGEHGKSGTALRNSLWNLLFRVLSSTDFARVAWTAVLRGACLSFFKEPIDELPLSDNDASRLALKDRFFDLPEHRVYAPAPRVYYAPPPEQVWVPGHYEGRYERQWVPGHWEAGR